MHFQPSNNCGQNKCSDKRFCQIEDGLERDFVEQQLNYV